MNIKNILKNIAIIKNGFYSIVVKLENKSSKTYVFNKSWKRLNVISKTNDLYSVDNILFRTLSEAINYSYYKHGLIGENYPYCKFQDIEQYKRWKKGYEMCRRKIAMEIIS